MLPPNKWTSHFDAHRMLSSAYPDLEISNQFIFNLIKAAGDYLINAGGQVKLSDRGLDWIKRESLNNK